MEGVQLFEWARAVVNACSTKWVVFLRFWRIWLAWGFPWSLKLFKWVLCVRGAFHSGAMFCTMLVVLSAWQRVWALRHVIMTHIIGLSFAWLLPSCSCKILTGNNCSKLHSPGSELLLACAKCLSCTEMNWLPAGMPNQHQIASELSKLVSNSRSRSTYRQMHNHGWTMPLL